MSGQQSDEGIYPRQFYADLGALMDSGQMITIELEPQAAWILMQNTKAYLELTPLAAGKIERTIIEQLERQFATPAMKQASEIGVKLQVEARRKQHDTG